MVIGSCDQLVVCLQVPVGGETFVLEISSDEDGAAFGQSQVEVTVQPRMSAVFQFQEQSRFESRQLK